MAHFPIDLLSDLFLRLPASSLVRCRVLSKPCISLIDSPEFVASHLKRTLETGGNLMILLRTPDGLLRTVYLDAPDKVTEVDHPLRPGGFAKVFGSSNGLIGLRNALMEMAVFNLSTRKIHRLPLERVDIPDSLTTCNYVMYGFGYDSVSQDYKVLRMVQCRRTQVTNFSYELKVFTLKSNSWKRLTMDRDMELIFFCLHYIVFCRIQNGVLASNHFHWILPPSPGVIQGNTFVRFDLASEEFDILNPPKYLQCDDTQGNMDIGVLDGCLCLTDYTEFTHVDVWVLKEYKVDGDWTKLFRVTEPEIVQGLEFLRPMVYSKRQEQGFAGDQRWEACVV